MYFKFCIKYVNEAGNAFDHSSGVVWANNYYGAMKKIACYYGDELIETVKLYATDEDTVYECDIEEEE